MRINIYDILFWIFFVISIILFIWYVFGDSPPLEETLLIFILGFVIMNYANINALKISHNNLKKRFNKLEEGFINLAKDFKEHLRHII